MSKRMFFLILAGFCVVGILLGFSIGYITAPIKEVEIQKSEELDRTVLSTTVETALAKKQESLSQQIEEKKSKETELQIEKKEEPKQTEIQLTKKEEPKQTQEKEVNKKAQEIENKDNTKTLEQEKQDNKSLAKKHKKSIKTLAYSFYTIQVGAFSEISNAKALMEKAESAGYRVILSKEDVHKVRIGKYAKYSQAKKISEELKAKGFENFIVKIKETARGGKT